MLVLWIRHLRRRHPAREETTWWNHGIDLGLVGLVGAEKPFAHQESPNRGTGKARSQKVHQKVHQKVRHQEARHQESSPARPGRQAEKSGQAEEVTRSHPWQQVIPVAHLDQPVKGQSYRIGNRLWGRPAARGVDPKPLEVAQHDIQHLGRR